MGYGFKLIRTREIPDKQKFPVSKVNKYLEVVGLVKGQSLKSCQM